MLNIFSKKFLYFPGCFVTSVTPEIVSNYKKVMDALKVDYYTINDIGCCGAVALNSGYNKDFEELMNKNKLILDRHRIKTIVTNSGNCMRTFALNYGINVQHISQILAKYVNKFPVKYEEEVSIYDSPSLRVYDKPREILDALGFDVIDLRQNRDDSLLCGYEGGMIQNTPLLAKKMTKFIFDMVETKTLIVIDPLAYYHLKNNAPKDVKVLELSEVLV